MIPLNTANTALIRVPVTIYDLDGNPATGVTATGAELQISKAGAAMANASGTLVENGGGSYHYQGVVADANTQGVLVVKVDVSGYLVAFGGDDVVPETADTVWDEVIEGAYTARQLLRGYNAVLLAKASGFNTTTRTFRDLGDTKDRVIAAVDASGRTAVTLDLT